MVALLGLLTLFYSLTRPWVSVGLLALRLEYKPYSLFEQMLEGKWGLLSSLLRAAEELPGGVQFFSLFILHLALLVIALLFSFLSIIGNSVGSYAATAVFSTLSVAVLVYTLEQVQPLTYAIGSGSLLCIGSAFVYVAAALTAKALRS